MKLRTTSALAVATLSLVALAGCGKAETTVTTTTAATTTSAVPAQTPADVPTTGPMTLTDDPTAIETTAIPTAGTPVGTAAATTAASPSVAAKLPTDMGDYGDAAVAAWSKGDLDELSRYVAKGARAKLAESPAAGSLMRVACEGDQCSYSSDAGKRVTLTFDPALVAAGKPGGITGVTTG